MRPGKQGYWYELEAYLPDDIECEHCVLQWRYHCGNNWGRDEEGVGIGFGLQEEFYGCADIKITSDGNKLITTKPSQNPTTTELVQSTATTQTTVNPTSVQTTQVSTTSKITDNDHYCKDKSNGLYKHTKCSRFYQCVNGITYERLCQAGLQFNSKYGFCDWATNVQC